MKPMEVPDAPDLPPSWHHGTVNKSSTNILPFWPLTHFGTRRAAVQAMARKWHQHDVRGTPEIYEVRFKPGIRVVSLPDFLSPKPIALLAKLESCGHISEALSREAKRALIKIDESNQGRPWQERRAFVRKAFPSILGERLGLDAVIYRNTVEDIGKLSLCVVRPEIVDLKYVEIATVEELSASWAEIA
jgi:hypothetical protein